MASQVAFVDTRLIDWQVLVDELDPAIEVVLLDPERDGVQQIADALAGRSDIDAIHIVSHGGDGTLYLGNTVLSSANLDEYADELAAIGAALSEAGDLLLYGCNVADSETGRDFIEQLARYTGADVAASDDLTGAARLGGDWALEASAGSIESQAISSASFDALLISEINLSDIAAGTGGFAINGQCAYDGSSRSVAGAGDVNGDGLADLIVGANLGDPPSGDNAGRCPAAGASIRTRDASRGAQRSLSLRQRKKVQEMLWA